MPRSTVDRIEAGISDPRLGTLVTLLDAIGYELAVCTRQGRLLKVDPARDFDAWWGWWRKDPKVGTFPPAYRYWWRYPSIGFTPWEDAT